MDISSATYDSASPTNLDNFTNPLRLPGDDGIMGPNGHGFYVLRLTVTEREDYARRRTDERIGPFAHSLAGPFFLALITVDRNKGS